jgi:hypothetical protein
MAIISDGVFRGCVTGVQSVSRGAGSSGEAATGSANGIFDVTNMIQSPGTAGLAEQAAAEEYPISRRRPGNP